jgi:chromosome segregation ATPase
MVSMEGAVFSGPMFSDGNKVFVLHAEGEENGNGSKLRFHQLNGEQTHAVLTQAAQLSLFVEELEKARATISSQRQTIANLESAEAGAEKREIELTAQLADWQKLADRLATVNEQLAAERVNLDATLEQLAADRVALSAQLDRYIDAVGPLDAPAPNINDTVQMRLDEIAAEQSDPLPPPVVESGPAIPSDESRNLSYQEEWESDLERARRHRKGGRF